MFHLPAIEVSDFSLVRGKNHVLHNVTFTLESGKITGLLGPSGSGKTSLLRAIVGVQRIKTGSITVLGRAAGDPSLRHELGYVTQGSSVYVDLTVLDNVLYFGAMFGCGRAQALEAIERVGLESFAKRKASELSGGQFSRISLACALVAKPRLLILDEPTVGLDPVLRAELWKQFAQMASAGTTLVVSSHVMEEAGHCDSLLLLRGGRLLAHVTPHQLRKQTSTEDLELAFLRTIEADESRAVA